MVKWACLAQVDRVTSIAIFNFKKVKYMDGPCGLPNFWIWSLVFQKYMNGPYGFHFVTHLVPSQQI
ncbi:hypothetical protein Hanom_Chr04g00370461 [Helianthus anomalus]